MKPDTPPLTTLSEDEKTDLIETLTTRAVAQIYPSPCAFKELLARNTRLTVYMGIDPTGPDMHIGHESQLFKLRALQRLGHRVVLLIGDFTAMIGDPTDKTAARVKLTREQVLQNATSYKEQAAKILDFDDQLNPVELRYNSEWLEQMTFSDVLELSSEFTVQQMLERDMFQKRLAENKPVGLHEFLYPMMQGYDSVALDTDIEIGGSDQIFNMLVGSTLLHRLKGRQKFVIAGQLLVDPSGKKIGKTEGNMITLNDSPLTMFHKVMLFGDGITPHALELCTSLPMSEIKQIAEQLAAGELSGLDGKVLLAKQLVTELYSATAAETAYQEYSSLTAKSVTLDRSLLERVSVSKDSGIISILVDSGLCASNGQARRLLAAHAVRVDEQTVDDTWHYDATAEVVLQVGKKKLENHRLVIPNN